MIPYSGEIDEQRQAADRVVAVAKELGLDWPCVIGAGMGHKIDPASAEQIDQVITRWASEPIALPRREIDFVTYTLRSFSPQTNVPVFCFPNPENPDRYVIINSGMTFREFSNVSNSRQTKWGQCPSKPNGVSALQGGLPWRREGAEWGQCLSGRSSGAARDAVTILRISPIARRLPQRKCSDPKKPFRLPQRKCSDPKKPLTPKSLWSRTKVAEWGQCP